MIFFCTREYSIIKFIMLWWERSVHKSDQFYCFLLRVRNKFSSCIDVTFLLWISHIGKWMLCLWSVFKVCSFFSFFCNINLCAVLYCFSWAISVFSTHSYYRGCSLVNTLEILYCKKSKYERKFYSAIYWKLSKYILYAVQSVH